MRVTDLQREEIKTLTASGMLQKHIAKKMGLCNATICNQQRKLGISPNRRAHEGLPAPTEKAVVKLLRRGHGAPFICKTLAVPQNEVYKLKQRFKIVCKPGQYGFRYYKSVLELRALRKRLRESERKIAKEFGVSREWLRGFRRSHWWDGSATVKGKNMNMNPDVNLILRDCVHIIEAAIRTLDGKTPDKAALVAALAAKFAPEKPADAIFFLVQPEVYQRARLNFIMGLDIAADIYLADRAAMYSN